MFYSGPRPTTFESNQLKSYFVENEQKVLQSIPAPNKAMLDF